MEINFGPSLYLAEEPQCPVCDSMLSGVTAVNDSATPEPGDFTVCAYCATLLRFGDGLKLRPVIQEDRDELKEAEPDTLAVLDKLAAAVRMRNKQERKRWH